MVVNVFPFLSCSSVASYSTSHDSLDSWAAYINNIRKRERAKEKNECSLETRTKGMQFRDKNGRTN